MSIAAVAATYQDGVPNATLQKVVTGRLDDNSAYKGTATFVLDGSTTTATLNFLDGTKKLAFTPSAIICSRIGGTGLASIHAYATVVDDATATITFSAAGTSTNTISIGFIILK